MAKKKHLLKTLTILNSCALGGIYLVNRFISSKALAKNILKTQSGHFFSWRYGNVYYQTTGTGEQPLLLIHDVNAISSEYEWSSVLSTLGEKYRVYSLDLLGCGRSDKPAMTYTNYLYVQLITDFLHEIIGKKTIVAASGLSSSVAVMTALADTSLVKQLFLVNPPSLKRLASVPDRKSRAIRSLLCLPIIGTCLYNISCSRQNIEYYFNERYYYNPFKVKRKAIDAFYEASHEKNGGGRYLQASLEGKYLNWNINRALSILKQPITILYGEKLEKGREIIRSYQRYNPKIRVCAVPASKSLPHLENPEGLLHFILPG